MQNHGTERTNGSNARRIAGTAAGLACAFALACSGSQLEPERTTSSVATSANVRIVTADELDWQALNPARGDASPRAATLWGDRGAEVPTGFLAKFVDGFSSPPHIHNVTYRAVVLDGLVHNDDPAAADMWMPAGSFWTQPKGEVHVTSAKGTTNVALVEIDRGPYLVQPPEDAFDSGERPVNVDASNLVWVDAPNADGGVKLAHLWADREGSHGTFVKLPAGYAGTLRADGTTLHVVVITGPLLVRWDELQELAAGSYLGAEGRSRHALGSSSGADCVLYVRTNGPFELFAD